MSRPTRSTKPAAPKSKAPQSKGPNRNRTPPRPRAAPRRRRAADDARAAILDVTERQLVSAGPAGIRLQDVAAGAGVSHPTVLHHFGSREALVNAVITRALAAVHARLIEAIARSSGESDELAALLDGVFDALVGGGHARVILWLALEGQRVDDGDAGLAAVVSAAHHARTAKRTGKCAPATREDTAHTVVLAALALVGGAVLGPALLENAGLPKGPAAGARFRAWLARLLSEHLER